MNFGYVARMRIADLLTFLTLSVSVSASAATVQLDAIAKLAPDADRKVLRLALQARDCAIHHGEAEADDRLAVIDYSQASTERRLWVFEFKPLRLLHAEHVAHGRGSGENFAAARMLETQKAANDGHQGRAHGLPLQPIEEPQDAPRQRRAD